MKRCVRRTFKRRQLTFLTLLLLGTLSITILLLSPRNEEQPSWDEEVNDNPSKKDFPREQPHLGNVINDSTTPQNETLSTTECTKIVRQIVVSNKQNKSSALNLPNIFNYLPHLSEYSDLLEPRRMKNVTYSMGGGSDNRTFKKRTFVIGIPTVKRPKQPYLLETLQSLFKSIKRADLSRIVIIIYIGETDQSHVDYVMEQVKNKFLIEVQEGIIDVIAPPQYYYPDLDHLPSTFNDPKERVKWRSKQNLDYSYLMMYAQKRGQYYLQLEDDIVATNDYLHKIEGFVNRQQQKKWFMLEFCRLGFIGKLFHVDDLSNLVEFFLMFYKVKPNDWLLDHYINVLVCSPEKGVKECNAAKKKVRIVSQPSLFQHVGKHSSLKGKVQKLIDKAFPGAKKIKKLKGEDEFFPHKANVKAKVHSNAVEFSRFKIQSAYDGVNLAWIKTPANNTFITFQFHTPVIIKRFLFRTGNKDHPGDILKYGVVEALTAKTMKHLADTSKIVVNLDENDAAISPKNFAVLATFNDKGLAQGNVAASLGEIVELRIRVTVDVDKNWVIFNEFLIEK